jgi:hypothetical protein
MGGLAIRIASPSAGRLPFERSYRDFDLIAHAKDVGPLRRMLESEGYVGDKLFNAIHGASRLMYSAADGRWSTDILIDELEMSHRLDLRDRLSTDGLTLDLADLLLTKLQIWETNRKDLGDAACLLADHPLARVDRLAAAPGPDGAPAPIDLARIRSILGSDWGWCHTAERNLRAIAELVQTSPIPNALYSVDRQVLDLLADIAAAPKTLGWKTRARIGEQVRWLRDARGSAPLGGRRRPRLAAVAETGPDEGRTPVVGRRDQVVEDRRVLLLERRDHLEDQVGRCDATVGPAPRGPGRHRSDPRRCGSA